MKHVGIQDNIALLDVANTFIENITVAKSAAAAAAQVDISSSDTAGYAAATVSADGARIYVEAYGSAIGDGFDDVIQLYISGASEFRWNVDGTDRLIMNATTGALQLPTYGAGVLTSDGSGNITSVPGGSGISESLAIAYAIALG